ncbi:hypothetical protein AYL99_00538 [Fonsecaea erecta]|uniref:Uncharacterized protein n=1 Tax=Fonsecaea erecta TaxID=1367422 RepID=A0A178ZYR1_9EURO|nr:hypothetical protein AYL99_00538 [Fonsecaea erecta]OAP64566.1 hypothetical protein AYL99_00538 [Fonsecaea erecta]
MTVLRASILITVVASGPTLSVSASGPPATRTSTAATTATTTAHFTPSLPAVPPLPASTSMGPTLFGGLAIGSIATMAGVTIASILFIRHKRTRRTQYQWVSQADPARLRVGN